MYWKFTKTPEKPKTLADAPEGVRCVVKIPPGLDEQIRIRHGGSGHTTGGERWSAAEDYTLIQILDPVPEQSAPKSVLDLPEGVCAEDFQLDLFFHYRGTAYKHRTSSGEVEAIHRSKLPTQILLPGITATLVQN